VNANGWAAYDSVDLDYLENKNHSWTLWTWRITCSLY
jgi:hypothetical protein